MTNEVHYKSLENMYIAAPINKIFPPDITVSEGMAVISLAVKEDYYHTAGSLHGSVYFKLLDDSAIFAAASLESECFMVTSSFNLYLTRPVVGGKLRAEGKVVSRTKKQCIAEAILYDDKDREVARGSGLFVPSRMKFASIAEYCS